MTDTQKKVAIGLGIVALLVWYSKKAKGAETTTTEEPSSGGGGGGIGGAMPMGITMITTPIPTTTTTSKPSTPTNLSPSLKNSGGVQSAGTKPIDPIIMSGGAGGIIQGGGIVVNSGYKPSTPYTPTSGGTPIGGGFGGGSTSPTSSSTATSPMNESVKCPNNKIYSVSSADIKSSGGTTSWCQRNGHYAGLSLIHI